MLGLRLTVSRADKRYLPPSAPRTNGSKRCSSAQELSHRRLYLLARFAAFLLNKTRFGRYVYAIGSNEEATRLSGVNVSKYKILAYMVCGLFSGLGAILFAATYTTATPGTGNGFETYAIAAVIIGGTSMAGGSGTMVGTLIGIFIMAVLRAGLSSMGLQSHWQTFFTGVVVIGAVLMDNLRTRAGQRQA